MWVLILGVFFQLVPIRSRKAANFKVYLCLFICMATKAVHLELVTDLSTSACLAAFKRFASLRGIPANAHSDNRTNFVGANNQFEELCANLSSDNATRDIGAHLTAAGSKWHFNPPASPHFGELWEVAIKSTKQHMTRVVGTQLLTFEELTTLFAQVSAILNSQPLCALSTDPHEYDVLTPSHSLSASLL